MRAVLELGCGCGLPSLALLSACQSCTVDTSDADEEALSMARVNLEAFVSSDRCRVMDLQWGDGHLPEDVQGHFRSEEHTSELQSVMRPPPAVFCLTKQQPSIRSP